MKTREETIAAIKRMISEETGIAANEIQSSDTFFNLGLDSVSCVFIMDKLEKELHVELNALSFWDYPTVETYADFLVHEHLSKHGN